MSSLTSHLNAKLAKPVGFTACPLDARFSVIRCQESNIANFVCDLMRFYYSADCTIMAGGTIRGDQIYPAGVVKLKDIVTCFPFEDPVVVCRLTGAAIVEALENGVSKLPALEGRFPHVSGMKFSFDVSRPVGDRIVSCVVAGVPVDKSTYDKKFSVATRGYMMKGKDGFTSLIGAEEVVDEESGVLISTILRQYFLSLKILGKWTRGDPLRKLFGVLRKEMEDHGELVIPEKVRKIEEQHELGVHEEEEWQVDSPSDSEDSSDDLDEDETTIASAIARGIRDAQDPEKKKLTKEEKEIARRMGAKWARIAGVKTNLQQVEWTVCINPKIEGRITDVTPKGLGEAAEKMGEAVEQVVAEAN